MKKIFTISALIALFTLAFNADLSAQNSGSNGNQSNGTIINVDGNGNGTLLDHGSGQVIDFTNPVKIDINVNDEVVFIFIPWNQQTGGARVIFVVKNGNGNNNN